jgi:hypothetical protein
MFVKTEQCLKEGRTSGDVRQAFSIHVHVAEVLAGTGVYKCSKNL